jgi:hypothetical protein
MARKYEGPRLTGGKVHYPGKSGHLNQATSASMPKLANGAVSDPKGNFARSIKPGAKLAAKAAQPTGPMLPQNVGKGPAPAPKPSAPQAKHSVMQPAPRPAQPQARGETKGAVMPPAEALKPPSNEAAKARDLRAAQEARRAHQRRGFGRDAQGNPFKASRQ